MVPSLLFEIAIIGILGIGSQWVAWKFRLPAIVVMSITGLLVGPIFGILDPQAHFGDMYGPIISAAVAIILFEGSLNLNFKELRGLGRPVFRISTLGAFIAWIAGSLTAHYVAGLSWAVAFVIGGLFIVTGPTVIMPLLRQAKLKPRPAKILKWEGIVVDPIGALVAVFAFEIITVITADDPDGTQLLLFFAASIFAAILGWALGKGLGWMFETGHVPEFLKSPFVVVVVIFCFTLADTVMHETGLLAVTAMGITLANMGISSISDMRHFKENISVLLISTIFIMLTASLEVETLLEIFSPNIIGYVLLMMFLVRPLSIFLSTIGTGLSFNEKALVGWIAPRGIVALTVSGYFAAILLDAGYEDAQILTSLTFALVFITVLAHGFSIGWLARKLDLSSEGNPGALIIGSNPFTARLAQSLNESNIPVIIVDSAWENLSHARKAAVPFYHGDMLSEQTEHMLDTIPYDYLLAITDDDAYNSLACTTFLPEYGRTNVFKISPYTHYKDGYSSGVVSKVGGRILFDKKFSLDILNEKLDAGFVLRQTTLTEKYGLKQYLDDKDESTVFLYLITSAGVLKFFSEEMRTVPSVGDKIVSLTPPIKEQEKIKVKLETVRKNEE
ncbi:sodium:proton antiporter [Oceanobacillus piezotolerans]|uniref:Sodium:proton antiporter n=1 Tax=Oceanobacillus piezotolerans TaxID=2448030 RepID=A0A498D4E3_9BACI|nr:sodium:proton antiporter [Oceanobacillus piezotolerans]RLL42829.1 sodium:proton antiporter [Oceanobacillus piezotolerans]